jgi:hypothetical protein
MSTAESSRRQPASDAQGRVKFSRIGWGIAIAVALWFALSEGATEIWYRLHEMRATKNPAWSFLWPDSPEAQAEGISVANFQEFPVAGQEVLHFDRARAATWQAGDIRWIVTVLEWNPGTKASAMDSRHNPMICLPSVGFQLVRELGSSKISSPVGDISFRGYEFRRGGGTPYVFSAIIRPLEMPEGTLRSGRFERRLTQLEKAVNGNRQSPERILLIAVEGPKTPEAAEKALRETFPGWVKVS